MRRAFAAAAASWGLLPLLLGGCESPDIFLFPGEGGAGGTPGDSGGSGGETPETRDVREWPFATTSFWNTPVGDEASYVPARLVPVTEAAFAHIDVVIVLEPQAPSTQVFFNPNGYTRDADRCSPLGELLLEAPIPEDFVLGSAPTSTPNREATFLRADGFTLVQTEPFYRCVAGGVGTSLVAPVEADLRGDGRAGASGGSGLSSMGGALRIGELRPNGGHVRHALRLHVDGAANLWDCSLPSECFRWPASKSNSHAVDLFKGANSALRSGALLALPTSEPLSDLDLETKVAEELAWTLQNFGGYVVNDAGWSTRSIATELSPRGSFVEQFRADWGIDLHALGFDTPFARDLERLFSRLAVVDDNSEATPGGHGARRYAPAPPFDDVQ